MTKQVDRELFAGFLEEMSGYVPEVERALACYFADHARTDCLEQAHRLTHTISGASAMLGLSELSDAARSIEHKLEEIATGERASNDALAAEVCNDFASVTEQLLRLAADFDENIQGATAASSPAEFDQHVKPDEEAHEDHLAFPPPELTVPEAFEMPNFGDDGDAALAPEFLDSQFDEASLQPTMQFDAPTVNEQFGSDELPPPFAQTGAQQFDVEMQADLPAQIGEQPSAVVSPKVEAIEAVDPEMLEVFQEEAEEHLRTMSAGLAALASNPDDRDVLQDVRRSTHTLKGAAGVVGLKTAARVAHRMEDLLDQLYENHASVDRAALNLLLRSTDVIEHLARGATPDSFRLLFTELYAQYDSLFAATSKGATPLASIESRAALPQSAQSDGADAPSIVPQTSDFIAREAEFASNELIKDAPAVFVSDALRTNAPLETRAQEPNALRSEDAVNTFIGNSEAESQAAGKRANARRVVRVPLERLDSVMKLVGELVISRTALENYVADLQRENEELLRSTERLRRVSIKLETEYEASFLRSGAERITGFAGASAEAIGNTDYFNPAGLTRLQLASPTAMPPTTAALSGATQEWMPPARASLYSHNVSETASGQGHGFDELELDRYTEFHRLTRQLAEASTDAAAVHNELKTLHGNFEGALLRQRRLTNDVQERLMRVRMIPLQTLAARLERTVRVAADAEGKQARLIIDGASVELDTTVLDQMADPLLHILRNAVSHGIESVDARRALGKSEQGTINLRAAYEGSQVVITITDDGGGIDSSVVCARAVEANFITEEAAARMTEKDKLALVFLPGLSTAGRVSEISGRGVGMDVVRDTVERLQGTLDLESNTGAGTRLTIRLPLTLAVTRALLVRSHGATYAIPTSAVRHVVHAGERMLDAMRSEGILRIAEANYEVSYPVIHLAKWLRLTEGEIADNVKRAPVLILRTAGEAAALVADEIVEGREIVVKSFGAELRRIYGVMGATVMGDGRVIPILNPDDIVRSDNRSTTVLMSSAHAGSDSPLHAAPRSGAPRRRVLIVDDSPSVRRVMMNLLKHTEWIAVPAKDGLDALEILHNSNAGELPSVILLDVEMPRMDGYELLATLRQQETMRHIPVVMITSRAGEKHRQKALSLGASEYLTKPYQDDVLLASITRLAALPLHQPSA
ncbi:MAG: response regulator [Pyrinomonadaceae bacterium]|nr:response regulator [Pyrinomonadaceae bacterium]